MRAHCSKKVQIKAAGGVRDLDGLLLVRELGGTRCGASATEALLSEYEKRLAEEKKSGKGAPGKASIGSGGY
jgi:deoxyribose-phosphate aldolase